MAKTVHLATPLTEAQVRELELDDVVYLTGSAYTMMYPDHFTGVMGLLRAGEPLPMTLAGGAIYNTGTIFRRQKDGSYELRAIGTTTSSKFNPYTPEFIRMTGIRAVIGKGGMDERVLEAMQECGCVYLAAVGGCSAVYTPNISVVEEYWPHKSWADNQLRLHFRDAGPFFVGMDAHGNSLYADCMVRARRNLPGIYGMLGIQAKEAETLPAD